MKVWIDGELKAPEEAVIGVFDRAVLFGESVYEGVRICKGRAPMLARHRRRLARGLEAIGLDPALAERLDAAVRDLLGSESIEDGLLYLQVTGGGTPGVRRHARGARGAGNAGTGNAGKGSRVFAFVTPCDPVPAGPVPVAAIRREDRRWSGCNLKTTNLLANVLALTEAAEQGAEEAILVSGGPSGETAGGRVSEGAYTSVFAVLDGVLHTSPTDGYPPILPGVTREVLCERLAAAGTPIRLEAPPASRLDEASEIMITSSRRLVASVVRLDGVPVGGGRPGPVAHACLDLLREAFLSDAATTTPNPASVPAVRNRRGAEESHP